MVPVFLFLVLTSLQSPGSRSFVVGAPVAHDALVRVLNPAGTTRVLVRDQEKLEVQVTVLAAEVPGWERFVRLRRTAGEDLAIEIARDAPQPLTLTVRAPPFVHVRIQGETGRLSVEGLFLSTVAETTDGPLTLSLPEDSHADLTVQSGAGAIRSHVRWDLQPGSKPHHVQARVGRGGLAILLRSRRGEISIVPLPSGGKLATPAAEAESLPGPVVRVESSLVSLNAVVTDDMDRGITDLRKEDFTLYEDGVRQEITHFAPVSAPFHLLLLLDLSGSTEEKTDVIRKSAQRFVAMIQPEDRVAVLGFTHRVRVISHFTPDKERVRKMVRKLRSGGGTAFYDALWFALDELDKSDSQRKAMVIMTDGVDNSMDTGREFETRHRFPEVLERAAESGVLIDPIYLDTEYETVVKRRLGRPEYYQLARQQLQQLGDRTGGLLSRAQTVNDLEDVYRKIAAELRTVYSLGYKPPRPGRDGQWRAIKITVHQAGARVRAKKGYFVR